MFDEVQQELLDPPSDHFDPRHWVPGFLYTIFAKHEKALLLGHGYSVYALVRGEMVLVLLNL